MPFILDVHKVGTTTANKQEESEEGPVSISGLKDVRRMPSGKGQEERGSWLEKMVRKALR